MKIRFLHTNDFHGKLDERVMPRLHELREESDFYFDSGDAIRTGNLGIPLAVDPVWARFAELNCTASVLGNRETHPLRGVFEKKLEGHTHPVLCGNMRSKDGSEALPRTLILNHNGFKIGIVSTMVAMATEAMKTAGAWAYVWTNPIDTAVDLVREIRPQVDMVVALTHIGLRQDQVLAARCADIDIIFSGHSHTVLQEPLKENQTLIVQGGSHGRFAGHYEWEDGKLTGNLIPLTP